MFIWILLSTQGQLMTLFKGPQIYYGVHEPMSAAMHEFNEVIGLFDFILTRNQFLNRLKQTL
jgi:hypothetical protein